MNAFKFTAVSHLVQQCIVGNALVYEDKNYYSVTKSGSVRPKYINIAYLGIYINC